MIPSKSTQQQYSEGEAAEALGITVEQFRSLVRTHILDGEEDLPKLSAGSFRPSDLLILKILSEGGATSTTRH